MTSNEQYNELTNLITKMTGEVQVCVKGIDKMSTEMKEQSNFIQGISENVASNSSSLKILWKLFLIFSGSIMTGIIAIVVFYITNLSDK